MIAFMRALCVLAVLTSVANGLYMHRAGPWAELPAYALLLTSTIALGASVYLNIASARWWERAACLFTLLLAIFVVYALAGNPQADFFETLFFVPDLQEA